MANSSYGFGLRPVASPLGVGCFSALEKKTLSATNTIVGVGDPLLLAADGLYDKWTVASGKPIAGVAASYAAANSGAEVMVYTDPAQLFAMRVDSTTGTLTAATGAGLNAQIIDTSTTSRTSVMTIDESSGAADNSLPLFVVEKWNSPDNEYGQYMVWVVRINNHINRLEKVTGVA